MTASTGSLTSGEAADAAKVQTLNVLLVACAFGMVFYARGFGDLGPRWSLMACGPILLAPAFGVRRSKEWGRVVGATASIVIGVVALVLKLLFLDFVAPHESAIPILCVMTGVTLLLPATMRAFERHRTALQRAKVSA
jgi:hypothetical protein